MVVTKQQLDAELPSWTSAIGDAGLRMRTVRLLRQTAKVEVFVSSIRVRGQPIDRYLAMGFEEGEGRAL